MIEAGSDTLAGRLPDGESPTEIARDVWCAMENARLTAKAVSAAMVAAGVKVVEDRLCEHTYWFDEADLVRDILTAALSASEGSRNDS